MELPVTYTEAMREWLGTEADAFLATYEDSAWAGIRYNTLKKGAPNTEKRTKVSWTEAGYYLNLNEMPGKHPLHYAGAYYIQEPSAMSPAEFLPVEPGEAVLDLCAAPGGKSTRLGEKLKGQGFLLANDISASRAQALLKNLERFGVGNLFVTAEAPEKLAKEYAESFDKILVDAPCSGEGMFRKDSALISSWKERGPEYFAPLQKAILREAVNMLKKGGMLLYSTCTFAREEDEEVIEWILEECSDMHVVDMTAHALYDSAMVPCAPGGLKFLPHKLKGEGHFLCLLEKNGKAETIETKRKHRNRHVFTADEQDFFNLTDLTFEEDGWFEKDGRCYYLPEGEKPKKGIRYLRTGLLLGEKKKNRFEPSQALAMWLTADHFANVCDFPVDSISCVKYLKGETVSEEEGTSRGKDGWCLVCADGYPLGFAKRAGGMLKNKLEPGWRMQ